MNTATAIDEIRRRLIESAMNPPDLRIALQIIREVEKEYQKKEAENHE